MPMLDPAREGLTNTGRPEPLAGVVDQRGRVGGERPVRVPQHRVVALGDARRRRAASW